MKTKKSGIMLHACPRCQGDLFHDIYEEDFACLQCGRRFSTTMILQTQDLAVASTSKELQVAA